MIASFEALVASWVHLQSWGPAGDIPIEFVGSYTLDDHDGSVGVEAFIVLAGNEIFHVPVTYRNSPLEDADDSLIGVMDLPMRGTTWIYDGLRDSRFIMLLAAVSITGQGQGLRIAVHDGRWRTTPSAIQVRGGGWELDRVPVDGSTLMSEDDEKVTLANDHFALTAYRRLSSGTQPPVGLSATWIGQPDPIVLTRVQPHPS